MRAVHYCLQPVVALYTASAVLHHQYRLTRHCGLFLNVVARRHEGKVEYTQAQGSTALSVTVIFPSLNPKHLNSKCQAFAPSQKAWTPNQSLNPKP